MISSQISMIQEIIPYLIIIAGTITLSKIKTDINETFNTIYRSRYLKSFFTKKGHIWEKRAITALILLSLFLTFGVQTSNAAIRENPNLEVTGKISSQEEIDNSQFYQALQVHLMNDIAPNLDQYILTVEDAEAYATMIVDLGTMDSSIDLYKYNKTSPTYIPIVKNLTEYVLNQREENKTLYFNTLSQTIFAATVFYKLQILDMSLDQIKTIYDIDNQTNIQYINSLNITLKELFSNSIREEIADNPPSLKFYEL